MDRFITWWFDKCTERGISPMLLVLPFMFVVWGVTYSTIKGLWWFLTWGL